jgi:hypothetical protein
VFARNQVRNPFSSRARDARRLMACVASSAEATERYPFNSCQPGNPSAYWDVNITPHVAQNTTKRTERGGRDLSGVLVIPL